MLGGMRRSAMVVRMGRLLVHVRRRFRSAAIQREAHQRRERMQGNGEQAEPSPDRSCRYEVLPVPL